MPSCILNIHHGQKYCWIFCRLLDFITIEEGKILLMPIVSMVHESKDPFLWSANVASTSERVPYLGWKTQNVGTIRNDLKTLRNTNGNTGVGTIITYFTSMPRKMVRIKKLLFAHFYVLIDCKRPLAVVLWAYSCDHRNSQSFFNINYARQV